MKSLVRLPAILLLALGLPFATRAQAPTRAADPFASITKEIEQGRLGEAEKALRGILQSYPDDLHALSLLGVVLDSRHQFKEAEEAYLKAVKLAPDSASLLNNLGNHYLARGDSENAFRTFEKVLVRDPAHVNANLQTAQLALDRKEYALSLRCLGRLPKAEQQAYPVRLLRLRALWGSGEKAGAEGLLRELDAEAASDIRYRFALAMAFVSMERYSEAEEAFTVVLQADPVNFDILYNLAMSALKAGHLERAAEVFRRAQQVRPGDVDCLVGLARALMLGGKDSSALPVLVRASQLAPNRADILLLMAQATYNAGFYADTVIAYDKYLKLKPDDDLARRERAFALTRSFGVEEGIKELQEYIKRHPKDPWGYYKLAAAQSPADKEQSLESINKALELKPDLHEARYARGLLYLQLNRPAEAVADLKAYLSVNPGDVLALDQMGRALLKVGEPQAAVEYLQKAIKLNPEDGNLYFQLSRALRPLGRTQEMIEALDRFKQLGGAKEKTVPRPGLFDFLSLTAEEQRAQSVISLRDAIEKRPSEPEARLALADIYLRQNKTPEALALIDEASHLTQDPAILGRAARSLLTFNQYSAAVPLLESALRQQNAPDDLLLDYVVAKFHTVGAGEALAQLDQIPDSKRSGDFYLLRAQLLDALDRFPEAVEALNRALRAAPTHSELYLQACSFLIKHRQYEQALQLLTQSEKHVPGSPELALARAVILEMNNQSQEATEQLVKIQAQWPEWPLPYVIHGTILQSQHQAADAKQLLETAIALGSTDPSAYYHLTLAISDLTPNDNESAYRTISTGLKLDPHDPYMQAQAGKIALAMKDYPTALTHLQEAIRLYPDMADAHWLLANLYRAMGEREKQQAELVEVQRLNKLFPPGTQTPPSMQDLLFSVRKPGAAGAQRPLAAPKR
jgi:tetratricopeptide (TPR) repeat protein